MKKMSYISSNLQDSITLAISAKAKKMKSEGKDVISFSVGEPDFPTPNFIREAAKEFIDQGKIGYTAATGTPELKEEIIKKLKRDNNLDYKPGQIVVTTGAKQALANAIYALTNPGDEIIIIAPYWVTYPSLVEICGGKSVVVESTESDDFKINAKQLEEAITDKTKAVIINTPSNPCGGVYSEKELREIADVVKKHDLYVISDEIYEKLTYDNEKHYSIAEIDEDMYNRTIVINGYSKAYAMTGWRIGYSASNIEIASAMGKAQSHVTGNVNAISQHAGAVALAGSEDELNESILEFSERRDLMYDLVNKIKGISCRKPKGAFYIMVNISKIKDTTIAGVRINNSMTFANLLLENSYVAVVPGIGFGNDDFIRLSYATNKENIIEGLKRIENLLSNN